MTDTDRERRLIELVQRALEQQDRGERVDVDALCAAAPELRSEVAEVLGLDGELAGWTSHARDVDPRVGRVLGERYQISAVLGRGAMGVVYRAHDQRLGRDVALKTFEAAGGAVLDPERVARFEREAQLLAALRHPHVVIIHDQGHAADGTLFVVMELLDGAPLAALLDAGGVDATLDDWAALVGADAGVFAERSGLRLVLRALLQVAEGLHAAHRQGVVHRDVKPSNIQIRADGRAVLLDFGIATRADDPALTQLATPLGTPWYMAPEQARGGGTDRADPRLDVYGLAATLYHLLTGQPPHSGDGNQVLQRLLDDEPRPPQRLRPDLPRDLAAIVEKGMEREPRRRYPGAAAFAADLRAFLGHRPTQARPLTPAGRAWRRVRRRPTRYGLIATSLLLLVALGLGVPLWRAQVVASQQREYAELYAKLPALLAIEGLPGQRLLVDRQERGASLHVLDRLLELAPDDPACRLWRAALRLDQGDAWGARLDLRELAERAGDSDYLRELAARYAASDETLRGVEALDLAGLPEPKSALGHLVAGFHELRNRHVEGFAERAEQHLRRAAEAGLVPARDLRLIALLATGEESGARAPFEEAFALAHELRGVYGRDTARTAFARGTALLALKRYADAVEPLERADRLRPERHGPLHNLGVAWRRLGEPERALEYLRRAEALRPNFLNTQVTIAQVLKDQGRFAAALEVAANLPDDGSGELAWRRPEVDGGILLQRALRTWGEAPEQARADAEVALAAFDEAAAHAPSRRLAARLSLRAAIAANLAGGATATAAAGMISLLRLAPADAYQIANLEALLGDGPLSAEGHWYLRLWLLRLAQRLARGDTAFVERLEARYAAVKEDRPAGDGR